MRMRTVVLGVGLVVTSAAVTRRALRRHGTDEDVDAAPGGWATCSAPSARIYERTFGWLLGGLYRRIADDLARALAGIPGAAILEIGPGPGGLAVELALRVGDIRLTGLDVDPAMVERAALRARREGLEGRLSFVVGDVAALPFADATFDLVTSSFSAHHWPDGAAGFAEIRRVLRPGARAIVYDLPDWWGRVETGALPLAEAAAAGGFAGAAPAPFRWPGRLVIVQRLDAVARAAGP